MSAGERNRLWTGLGFISPWLFGFADIIWWPHLLIGLTEIFVPMVTRREEERPMIHA